MLKEKYKSEVIQKLSEEYSFTNPNEVPRMAKIVLNMGLGEAVQNSKIVAVAQKELSTIAGQKAMITKARRSIATFKLREGMAIGCMVTLRGDRMWEFLDRLIYVALPRVRDFKGISDKAFDGRGNYSLGIREQIVFPEIDYDKIDKIRGLNISLVTTAQNDDHGRSLLRYLGMPFVRREEKA